MFGQKYYQRRQGREDKTMTEIEMITAALMQKYNQRYRLHFAQVTEELSYEYRTAQNKLSRVTSDPWLLRAAQASLHH